MTFHYIPLVGADSPQTLVSLAFQSALLHSCIDNTLNLSTPVIGSYETWYICRATGMEEDPKVTLDIQCL